MCNGEIANEDKGTVLEEGVFISNIKAARDTRSVK